VADKFLPRLPAAQSSWGFLQVTWDKLCRLIEERFAANEAAIDSAAMLSDSFTVVSRSATYTEEAVEGVRVVKASGTFTINLPSAVGNKARYIVKLVGAGTVTLDPLGAQTIDGSATLAISTLNQTASILSDGANWLKVN
jgi:hypothetical protein